MAVTDSIDTQLSFSHDPLPTMATLRLSDFMTPVHATTTTTTGDMDHDPLSPPPAPRPNKRQRIRYLLPLLPLEGYLMLPDLDTCTSASPLRLKPRRSVSPPPTFTSMPPTKLFSQSILTTEEQEPQLPMSSMANLRLKKRPQYDVVPRRLSLAQRTLSGGYSTGSHSPTTPNRSTTSDIWFVKSNRGADSGKWQ